MNVERYREIKDALALCKTSAQREMILSTLNGCEYIELLYFKVPFAYQPMAPSLRALWFTIGAAIATIIWLVK